MNMTGPGEYILKEYKEAANRRSLEAYTKEFQEGPMAGCVNMKFFGVDVNEMSREELLGLVSWLADEVKSLQERNSRYTRGLMGQGYI